MGGGEREGRSKKEGWKWQELPNVYKPGFRLSGTPTGVCLRAVLPGPALGRASFLGDCARPRAAPRDRRKRVKEGRVCSRKWLVSTKPKKTPHRSVLTPHRRAHESRLQAAQGALRSVRAALFSSSCPVSVRCQCQCQFLTLTPDTDTVGRKWTRRRAKVDTPEGMSGHAGGYEWTRRRV